MVSPYLVITLILVEIENHQPDGRVNSQLFRVLRHASYQIIASAGVQGHQVLANYLI
jgi:hypothetical protein